MGGQLVIESRTTNCARAADLEQKLSAEGTLGFWTAGAEVEASQSWKSQWRVESVKVRNLGGQPNGYEAWAASVESRPVPIQMALVPLEHFLPRPQRDVWARAVAELQSEAHAGRGPQEQPGGGFSCEEPPESPGANGPEEETGAAPQAAVGWMAFIAVALHHCRHAVF